MVCSTRRNAAFNLYTPEGQVHRNLGYWLETSDGHRYASCAWSTGAQAPQERDDRVLTEGACVRVDDGLPLVRHEVAFRAATGWVFQWPSVAEPFHRFIKRRKIARQVAGPFTFTRELTWRDDALIVNDFVRARAGAPALRRVTPTADIEVHSPSARLSGSSPNHAIAVSHATAEAWAGQINTRGHLHLVTTYALDRDGCLRLCGIGEPAASSEPATLTTAPNPAEPRR